MENEELKVQNEALNLKVAELQKQVRVQTVIVYGGRPLAIIEFLQTQQKQ